MEDFFRNPSMQFDNPKGGAKKYKELFVETIKETDKDYLEAHKDGFKYYLVEPASLEAFQELRKDLDRVKGRQTLSLVLGTLFKTTNFPEGFSFVPKSLGISYKSIGIYGGPVSFRVGKVITIHTDTTEYLRYGETHSPEFKENKHFVYNGTNWIETENGDRHIHMYGFYEIWCTAGFAPRLHLNVDNDDLGTCRLRMLFVENAKEVKKQLELRSMNLYELVALDPGMFQTLMTLNRSSFGLPLMDSLDAVVPQYILLVDYENDPEKTVPAVMIEIEYVLPLELEFKRDKEQVAYWQSAQFTNGLRVLVPFGCGHVNETIRKDPMFQAYRDTLPTPSNIKIEDENEIVYVPVKGTLYSADDVEHGPGFFELSNDEAKCTYFSIKRTIPVFSDDSHRKKQKKQEEEDIC
jgi:hypothetical protein